MTLLKLKAGDSEDLETIAGVMALAFTDDPWARAHAAPGEACLKKFART